MRNCEEQITWVVLVGVLTFSTILTPLNLLAKELVGVASWYGPGFEGRVTASGKRFDSNRLTLASLDLPLGTKVNITNLCNGHQVNATVNDKGPYTKGRRFDVSKAVAQRLGFAQKGIAKVKVKVIRKGLLAQNRGSLEEKVKGRTIRTSWNLSNRNKVRKG
jgi:rare lipoprotein A